MLTLTGGEFLSLLLFDDSHFTENKRRTSDGSEAVYEISLIAFMLKLLMNLQPVRSNLLICLLLFYWFIYL